MENWGLITYSEDMLCIHNETSTVIGKFNGVTVVSHELAHNWYGNLISCEWWDDTWIQEGFATHYNYLPTEYLQWDWMSTQLSDTRRGVQYHMTTDQKLSITPTVRREVKTPQQSKLAFNSGSYNKGGSIIRMIQGILTRPVFEKAMAKFLKKFSYSNVATKDLTDVLDQQAAESGITYPDKTPLKFQHILQSWLNIKGFPVVKVTKVNSSIIHLTQQLYLRPSGQQIPDSDKTVYSWEIPVSLVRKDGAGWDGPVRDWIPYKSKGKNMTIGSDADWYLLNPRQYFYYRVQYDQENRDKLMEQLRTDFTKILPETRSQLLEDYFEFARTSTEGIDVAMEFTSYLEKDFSHNTWQVSLKHAQAIAAFVEHQPFFLKFQTYFRTKLDKILETLKYHFPANETITKSFLRKDAFSAACWLGSGKCLSYSKEKFSKYILKPATNSIDSNLLPTILCDGVFRGKQAHYEIIKGEYLKRKESFVRDERFAYIFALTCSNDDKNLESIFQDLLAEQTFYWMDLNQVAQYLASTSYGADRLFKHLDDNWSASVRFNKVSTINTITLKWFSAEHVQKLKAFIKRREENGMSKSEADRLTLIQLQVRDNHAFHLGQTALLGKWLDKNVKPSMEADTMVVASNPPSAFFHWSLLEETYHKDMVGKQYWE